MAFIKFESVGVDIPVFNTHSRSFKNHLMRMVRGGKIDTNDRGNVVVHALQNLNFSFHDGERIGIIGQNGAGKSTLLRVLNKVYVPSHGQTFIQGEVSSLIDLSLGIDQEATGRENIFLRGALLGMSKREVNEKLDGIIEFSELEQFIDMPVRTYSSGMHLRLAFSVSTIIRSDILLMDEWLSVGDESFKHKAEARLAEIVQATKILVLASHSRELIMNTCNRVLWLENGSIKMDGSPETVCGHYFN